LLYADNGTLFSSDPSVYLQVVDSFGRTLTFSDNGTTAAKGNRQPVVVTFPDSDSYGYALRFSNIPNPGVGWYIFTRRFDGYPYGPTYYYGEPSLAPASLPYVLTGIDDASGSRFADYGYDVSGRAILTRHALNSLHASLVFNSDHTTQVTDADGTLTYAAVINQGLARNAGVSQPGGAGCAAANSKSVYDVRSNLVSQDDFNGHRTCYSYDALNRESVRVEGLANTADCSSVLPSGASLPAGSRKISTQWHPLWHVKTQVAMPGKSTAYVYQGQTDPLTGQPANCVTGTFSAFNIGVKLSTGLVSQAVVCKRIETPTLDANGAAGFGAVRDTSVNRRTWTYTYTEFGQPLTALGPRSDATSWSYYLDNSGAHTRGDLQSVTDALLHVTQFTDYDTAGRVLQRVDPNGQAQQSLYEAPGQLFATRRIFHAGQADEKTLVTRFSHDGEGQLTRVTQPDGTYVGYEYDAAHRLTAIYDDQGNRIEYQLDDEGRRKQEDVKDPGGNLARTLKREYDALGRLQRTTGQ
jgi:YD repeat-containing protein